MYAVLNPNDPVEGASECAMTKTVREPVIGIVSSLPEILAKILRYSAWQIDKTLF